MDCMTVLVARVCAELYAVATAMETAAIVYHYLGLNCPPYTYTQQYTLV